MTGSWFDLTCGTSGTHTTTATVAGGPTSVHDQPGQARSPPAEICTLNVFAANVSDVDAADPPDEMEGNATISFTVADDVVCGSADTPKAQI